MKPRRGHKTTSAETDYANIKMDQIFYGEEQHADFRMNLYQSNNTPPIIETDNDKDVNPTP
jgi:hypothetical protein